jgi:plasmid stabilization system protein ParE
VAASDPSAAERLVRKLVSLAESLDRLPNRGRRVPELPDGPLRELVHGKYRIVYRATSSAVEIPTVFEGHRRFPAEDVP